jgi:UDP-N-acetylglucosamine 2-epimerase
MPEEINRVVTDHLSDLFLLLCPTETAVVNFRKEGVTKGVHLVGDVMYDALWDSVERAKWRCHRFLTEQNECRFSFRIRG